MGVLSRLRNLIPTEAKLLLYKSSILAYLTYCHFCKAADVRKVEDTLMYKVKYGLVPSNVVDIFSVKSSKYHLRNMDFHLPRFNSVRYGEHSIRYFGPYIWSRLDSKIKDKPTSQSFKSNIRHTNLVNVIP